MGDRGWGIVRGAASAESARRYQSPRSRLLTIPSPILSPSSRYFRRDDVVHALITDCRTGRYAHPSRHEAGLAWKPSSVLVQRGRGLRDAARPGCLVAELRRTGDPAPWQRRGLVVRRSHPQVFAATAGAAAAGARAELSWPARRPWPPADACGNLRRIHRVFLLVRQRRVARDDARPG